MYTCWDAPLETVEIPMFNNTENGTKQIRNRLAKTAEKHQSVGRKYLTANPGDRISKKYLSVSGQ